MDSRSVSYTSPSRRNSSKAYLDLTLCRSYGQSGANSRSHKMGNIKVRISMQGSTTAPSLHPCTVHSIPHITFPQALISDIISTVVLTTTASYVKVVLATACWYCRRRRCWTPLCRCLTPAWLSSHHPRRTRSCRR
jgi:hypothetical protein